MDLFDAAEASNDNYEDTVYFCYKDLNLINARMSQENIADDLCIDFFLRSFMWMLNMDKKEVV